MVPLRLTKVIKILLIAYLAIFVIQQTADQFFSAGIGPVFSLIPIRFVNDWWIWQIFTYAFLHADVMHLFLNMLMLVFIGSDLDSAWGSKEFLKYYLFCSIFAGGCYLLMQVLVTSGLYSPMVGASGGIYGLLIAYGIIYGERTMLFLLLFPMKAKHFIWILAGVEFMTMVFSPTGNKFSAVAHLGGMVGGFGYLWIQAAYRIRKRQSKAAEGLGLKSKAKRLFGKKKKHLKLVVNRPGDLNDEDGGSSGGPPTWH